MRYALFARLLGLGFALGVGVRIATLDDPFEFFQADLADTLLRGVANALHNLRSVVIDLVDAFIRMYL